MPILGICATVASGLATIFGENYTNLVRLKLVNQSVSKAVDDEWFAYLQSTVARQAFKAFGFEER
jgi:hypothetical protein